MEKNPHWLRFLVFGDVVGSAGRAAVSAGLKLFREEYQPDSVIVNIENMAHGLGISAATFEEAKAWRADAYTTGDHAWDNKTGVPLLENKSLPIIRPANYNSQVSGRGYHVYSLGAYRVAVMNLQGQVFFKNHPANPFRTLDDLLKVPEIAQANIKLLDIHAEATSEKRGLGWYADGRISAMWGTHTHVPTADAQIMPKGTGFISDLGMNGAYISIIGREKTGPLYTFLHQLSTKFVPAEDGPLEINAVLIDINPSTGKTEYIAHLRKIIDDKA
jgi:metallophosphoesterase (TIGR00282 family)